MELHEFHVAEARRPLPAIGHRVAVARGDRRVARLAKELAGTSGREHDGTGPHQCETPAPVPDQNAAAFAIMRHQVDRYAVLPDPHVAPGACLEDDRPHDLAAGLVTQGVSDSRVRVAPFEAQGDMAIHLIEMRSPVDQLTDTLGRFAHHHFDDLGVAKSLTGRQGVGDVVVKPVLGVKDPGDAPLRVVAVALAHPSLVNREHTIRIRDSQRGPETPQSTPPMIRTSVK